MFSGSRTEHLVLSCFLSTRDTGYIAWLFSKDPEKRELLLSRRFFSEGLASRLPLKYCTKLSQASPYPQKLSLRGGMSKTSKWPGLGIGFSCHCPWASILAVEARRSVCQNIIKQQRHRAAVRADRFIQFTGSSSCISFTSRAILEGLNRPHLLQTARVGHLFLWSLFFLGMTLPCCCSPHVWSQTAMLRGRSYGVPSSLHCLCLRGSAWVGRTGLWWGLGRGEGICLHCRGLDLATLQVQEWGSALFRFNGPGKEPPMCINVPSALSSQSDLKPTAIKIFGGGVRSRASGRQVGGEKHCYWLVQIKQHRGRFQFDNVTALPVFLYCFCWQFCKVIKLADWSHSGHGAIKTIWI